MKQQLSEKKVQDCAKECTGVFLHVQMVQNGNIHKLSSPVGSA